MLQKSTNEAKSTDISSINYLPIFQNTTFVFSYHKKKTMGKIITLLFFVITLTSCQAQKVDLKLNLNQGENYKLTSNNKTTIIQIINGKKQLRH